MRMMTGGVAVIVALLIGLGVGYVLWGQRAADLREAMRQQADCEFRLAEATQRAQAAEQRIQQEMAARRVVEDALNKVTPQK
jgi:uncharacterized protein HemX